MQSALIVGGDGLIGHALCCAYKARGAQVFTTSRQNTEGNIPLDLSQPIDASALPRCDVAYLCAAISRFAACEQNPTLARRVNVTAQLELAQHFLSCGTHVVFLSSNAVFNGREDAPSEDARLSPASLYGQLKADAEEGLAALARQYSGDLSIVRLSKVLSQRLPLVAGWLSSLQSGQTITAFSDATLSPISLDYAVQGLMRCGAEDAEGTFHLSGEFELSYHAFAQVLAAHTGADQRLVLAESTHKLLTHNRLAMPHTESTLHIKAQALHSLLADLL